MQRRPSPRVGHLLGEKRTSDRRVTTVYKWSIWTSMWRIKREDYHTYSMKSIESMFQECTVFCLKTYSAQTAKYNVNFLSSVSIIFLPQACANHVGFQLCAWRFTTTAIPTLSQRRLGCIEGCRCTWVVMSVGVFVPCSCIVRPTSPCGTNERLRNSVALYALVLVHCKHPCYGYGPVSASGDLRFGACAHCIRIDRHWKLRIYLIVVCDLRWAWNLYLNDCGLCNLYYV